MNGMNGFFLTVKNMAAVLATADTMTIQKNSQILVHVEEALADLIVVSYCSENKKFQGVLLDSSKGNLPFGVYSLHPAFNKQTAATENENDKLHSVSQRFTYQEPQYATEHDQKSKKIGPKGKSQQRQRMTVRLRPRKVLCSNCKGICNENSENVDVSKKRKLDSDDDVQDSYESSNQEKKYLMGSMLIPKISRLHPNEITNAIKGGVKSSGKNNDKISSRTKTEKSFDSERATQELAFVSVPDDGSPRPDLKDEDDCKDATFSSLFSSARTLKICFGEGEGTVVKIPPLSGDFNEDSGVSCDMSKTTKPDSKAAKKAMKKAKKQAKKHTLEPDQWLGQSPKHVGALSPRNNLANPPSADPLEKKHKHRVKHKKKYKSQKKRDENTSKCTESESIDYFSDIKDHYLNQKLSISLRRLSSDSCKNRNEQDGLESDSDDCESEVVPDFPANGPESRGGRSVRVSPGDIVWGKVVGFPWWPGRVLTVTSASRAHVAWYASTTSSMMPCDSLSPFLEDFKIRFNKKKRGPYKEAVKLATIEAKRYESHLSDPLASPTHPNLTAMSPRAIDVFS